jgi:hypothetical protein
LNMVMQLKRTDDYVIFAGTKVSCLRMRMWQIDLVFNIFYWVS